jgi:hypothetical protein
MKIKAKNKQKQLNIRGMSIVRHNPVVNQKNGMICFGTEDSQIGLIFYPGGKV